MAAMLKTSKTNNINFFSQKAWCIAIFTKGNNFRDFLIIPRVTKPSQKGSASKGNSDTSHREITSQND